MGLIWAMVGRPVRDAAVLAPLPPPPPALATRGGALRPPPLRAVSSSADARAEGQRQRPEAAHDRLGPVAVHARQPRDALQRPAGSRAAGHAARWHIPSRARSSSESFVHLAVGAGL